MGVYIKGMEMPKEEELLCIRIYPNGKVSIDMDLACKQIATAVPVPPHGDLIDRDAMMLRVDMHGTNKFGMLDDDIREFITAAPTIIPAEEGET